MDIHVLDQAGQRTKIVKGLEFFYQMAMMEKPSNFDYLVKNWCKLLKNAPQLDRAFEEALKNNKRLTRIPTVYQVLEASKSLRAGTITGPIHKQQADPAPGELPTPDEYEKAMQTISAVIGGRIDTKEGHGWIDKIFSGKV